MTWNVPNWWQLALLALAAFRVWRLLGEDSILARPRAVFKRKTSDYWDQFLLCPWCAGFWITLVWWLAWIAWPHWTLIVATPLALSAGVGLVAANFDPD